ncbi:MAG: pitrilysin family protein [Planctomycetota bacterium]
MSAIRSTTLDCGLPLVVERMTGVRSLGVSWLLPMGSAHDPESRVGRAPVLAEMLLRGAGDLDSRAQADAFDTLGASRGTNVETFNISISSTLLGSRLSEVAPLLASMVREPLLAQDSLAPSKDLCAQAVASLEDDPQDRVVLLARAHHSPSPINRPSVGTEAGVAAVTLDDVHAWRTSCAPGSSVLALAGDVELDHAADLFNRLLDGWTGESRELAFDPADAPRGIHHEHDDTNQVHIAVASDGPTESDEDAWCERIVQTVLSGGMSGRLFTEVREKRSLVYSVYSTYAGDRRYGRCLAYAGTTPERAQETLDVLLDELNKVNTPAGRITEDEHRRALIGRKSKLVMSGESSGARASALAHDWIKLGRARSLDELASELDAVTLDRVNAYLERREMGRITVATLGPSPLTIPG